MALIHSQRRLYPQNGMAAHVIGYTGEISEQELDSPEYAKYDAGDVIGKFGIERQYNDQLMGVDGQPQALVDNRGNVRKVLGVKEAVPGKDLQLTLDLDLQAVAELAMEGRNGAVVAMDPRTGEILAMVSRPTFDPNKFAVRIKSADWKEIADNPDHPLHQPRHSGAAGAWLHLQTFGGVGRAGDRHHRRPLHRALRRRRELLRPLLQVSSEGRPWQRGAAQGHRAVLRRVLLQRREQDGYRQYRSYAEAFGLGHKTGIDLPQEKEGVVPSTKWKLRNFRQKWYAGETISVAIGQGALTVTPAAIGACVRRICHRRPCAYSSPVEEPDREASGTRSQAGPGECEGASSTACMAW